MLRQLPRDLRLEMIREKFSEQQRVLLQQWMVTKVEPSGESQPEKSGSRPQGSAKQSCMALVSRQGFKSLANGMREYHETLTTSVNLTKVTSANIIWNLEVFVSFTEGVPMGGAGVQIVETRIFGEVL